MEAIPQLSSLLLRLATTIAIFSFHGECTSRVWEGGGDMAAIQCVDLLFVFRACEGHLVVRLELWLQRFSQWAHHPLLSGSELNRLSTVSHHPPRHTVSSSEQDNTTSHPSPSHRLLLVLATAVVWISYLFYLLSVPEAFVRPLSLVSYLPFSWSL